MEELKPCPFCGSDKIDYEPGNDYNDAFIYCEDCPAEVTEAGLTKQQLFNAWNTRKEK